MMDSLDGFLTEREYQGILVALLFSPVEDPFSTQKEVPLVVQVKVPQAFLKEVLWTLGGGPPGPPAPRRWFFRSP